MSKAIETVYNGYRFRSRLEARWAVFFDTVGVKYEYEKEGFDLPSGRYLPDFYLPDQGCWIEIKGQKPTDSELTKLEELADHTMDSCHLFWGEIEIPGPGHFYEKVTSFLCAFEVAQMPVMMSVDETGWAQCPWCLSLNVTYHSMVYGLPCKCYEYIDKFIQQEPLRKLIGYCPDMIAKEPKNEVKYPSNFYELKITRWWRDKTNVLLYGGDSPRLIAAYTAARSARFEYGEKP